MTQSSPKKNIVQRNTAALGLFTRSRSLTSSLERRMSQHEKMLTRLLRSTSKCEPRV